MTAAVIRASPDGSESSRPSKQRRMSQDEVEVAESRGMLPDEFESTRPCKRRRFSKDEAEVEKPPGTLTPPTSDSDVDVAESSPAATGLGVEGLLAKATHVLATEAAALANISKIYQTRVEAKASLKQAVSAVLDAHRAGGKFITCGVGKSGYIAQKLVATCKSLGIGASFLHACEAVHGDLGDIRPHDVVLFVSYSGKTAELLNLLPHISASTRIMALSGHTNKQECMLVSSRDDGILLPAPIPEKEEISFGVAAPTTSTTVALAVADMLALTAADGLHRGDTKQAFVRNHPGGAIGVSHRDVEKVKKKNGAGFAVLELPSPSISGSDDG